MLGDVDFGPGVGIRQLDAFALLQGPGDLRERLRQGLGDFVGSALGLEEIGFLKQGTENPPVLGPVNLVVGKLVSFLNGAVEVGAEGKPGNLTP